MTYKAEYNGYEAEGETHTPLHVRLSTPDGKGSSARVFGVPATPEAVELFDYNKALFPQDVIDELARGYGKALEAAGWFSKEGVK